LNCFFLLNLTIAKKSTTFSMSETSQKNVTSPELISEILENIKNNNPLWQVNLCQAWMKNILRTELIAPQERLRICHIVSPGIQTINENEIDDVNQWIHQCQGVSNIDLTILVPDRDTANRLSSSNAGIKVVYPLSQLAETSDPETLLHTLRSHHFNWSPYHIVWCWEGLDRILRSEEHITCCTSSPFIQFSLSFLILKKNWKCKHKLSHTHTHTHTPTHKIGTGFITNFVFGYTIIS
jgi:hypothetical protein